MSFRIVKLQYATSRNEMFSICLFDETHWYSCGVGTQRRTVFDSVPTLIYNACDDVNKSYLTIAKIKNFGDRSEVLFEFESIQEMLEHFPEYCV